MSSVIQIPVEQYIKETYCTRLYRDIHADQFNEERFKNFSENCTLQDVKTYVLSEESPIPDTNKFTIYTQNMWGIPFLSKQIDNRFSILEEIIKQGKYDVLCLEEVWLRGDRTRLMQCGKDHNYPYSSDFATGFGTFMYPNFYGSGLLVLSKYPIIDTSFMRYSINGNPLKIWHSDYYMEKGVGLSRVNFKNTIIDIYITHTHAEYNPEHDEYAACRLSQLYQLAKFVSNTSKDNLTIIVGDLNIRPNSMYYDLFVSVLNNICDCWQTENADLPVSTGTYGNEHNTYVGTEYNDRLDYIFAYHHPSISFSSTWKLNSCNIMSYHGDLINNNNRRLSISLSDHEGIEAIFEYRNQKEPIDESRYIILSKEEQLRNLQQAGRIFYDKYLYYKRKHILASVLGFFFIILWILLFAFILAFPYLAPILIYGVYICPFLIVGFMTMSRYIYNTYSNNYYSCCNDVLSDIYNLVLTK